MRDQGDKLPRAISVRQIKILKRATTALALGWILCLRSTGVILIKGEHYTLARARANIAGQGGGRGGGEESSRVRLSEHLTFGSSAP